MFYKKVLSTVITSMLLFSFATTAGAEDFATFHICGDNVNWSFIESTGTLTIFGAGNMTDFQNESDVPWQSYRNSIKSVSIENGVTSIGMHAFHNCIFLASIDIPDSITTIKSAAFYNCTNLTSIKIPSSVTSFGVETFGFCAALTSLTIPPSVTALGQWTFFNCTGLTTIKILSRVTSMSAYFFSGCENLASITIRSISEISKRLFSDCESLKSFTYMDKNGPSCSNTTIFSRELKVVNVPSGYKNSTFCGVPIRRIPATHDLQPSLSSYRSHRFMML